MAEIMPDMNQAETKEGAHIYLHSQEARVVQELAGIVWRGFPGTHMPTRLLREICSSMLSAQAEPVHTLSEVGEPNVPTFPAASV
jgi:hypothetical protein